MLSGAVVLCISYLCVPFQSLGWKCLPLRLGSLPKASAINFDHFKSDELECHTEFCRRLHFFHHISGWPVPFVRIGSKRLFNLQEPRRVHTGEHSAITLHPVFALHHLRLELSLTIARQDGYRHQKAPRQEG